MKGFICHILTRRQLEGHKAIHRSEGWALTRGKRALASTINIHISLRLCWCLYLAYSLLILRRLTMLLRTRGDGREDYPAIMWDGDVMEIHSCRDLPCWGSPPAL